MRRGGEGVLALTVRQPMASLLGLGLIRYDVRTWRPPEWAIGRIVAIHAGTDPGLLRLMLHEGASIAPLLAPHGLSGPGSSTRFPRGQVIATARLVGVHDAERLADQVTAAERACGDWFKGRIAWEFRFVKPVTPPIAADGQRRLWSWKAPAHVVGVR